LPTSYPGRTRYANAGGADAAAGVIPEAAGQAAGSGDFASFNGNGFSWATSKSADGKSYYLSHS
jgi:hypothetical protein